MRVDAPTVDDVEAAVLEVWDFSRTYPTVRPDAQVTCGMCNGDLLVRWWRYFTKNQKGVSTPYRCDVSVKCCRCSALHTFGIVVPRDVWAALPESVHGVTMKRRRAQQAGLMPEEV